MVKVGILNMDLTMVIASCLMLIMAFLGVVAYVLAKHKIRVVHETGVGLLVGVAISKLLSLSYSAETMREYFGFSSRFFVVFLLPPIIFNSGYNMQQRYFFANISAVGVYAFLGTLISFVTTAALLMLAGLAGWHHWSMVECFLFGSVICATDTVGTVAIMETSPVSRDLFSIVLGESVFNDAVAIILHETCLRFVEEDVTARSLVGSASFFLLVFSVSTAIGIAFGVICTLILKAFDMRDHPHLEFVILLTCGYASYFVSTGLSFSGVCAILFAGVTMSHYTVPNLSPESVHLSRHALHPLSYLCETFVFLSLGLSVFAYLEDYKVFVIVLTGIFILIARTIHVFSLGKALNIFRHPMYKLSNPELVFLSFAGPRGAMSFALALDVETEHREQMLTVTVVICLFSSLVVGATTYPVLRILGLLDAMPAAGMVEDDGAGVDDGGHRSISFASGSEGSDMERGMDGEVFDYSKMESYFNRVDRLYFKPLLVRQDRLHLIEREKLLLPRGMDENMRHDIELDHLGPIEGGAGVGAREESLQSGLISDRDFEQLF